MSSNGFMECLVVASEDEEDAGSAMPFSVEVIFCVELLEDSGAIAADSEGPGATPLLLLLLPKPEFDGPASGVASSVIVLSVTWL